VRINWNDHTGKLQEINTATFNFDSLVEFLCDAALRKSKYSYIESILLKQALQNSGNVTVLMDGFDQISPTHVHKAAVILSELMKTKVERVWITSRPVEKERLEKILSVISFNMNKLSRKTQIEMLCNMWMLEAGDEKLYLDGFLRDINNSVHDETFTGCPLYIRTIANDYTYETAKNLYLRLREFNNSNMYLPDFHEAIVNRILHIYLTVKLNVDMTQQSSTFIHEVLIESLLKDLEKCALVAILPPTLLTELHDKKIEKKAKRILAEVQNGQKNIGIVMNVVDGKPQFVHRTFTQYFAARWFSRKFVKNRSVLKSILFDSTYSVMRDMFDRMLAKDCPLHCAVIDNDRNLWDSLLHECDVTALDKGGRTYVHLMVTHSSLVWYVVPKNREVEFSWNIADSVLQWTPLQYAIKLEKWKEVETLLENNVDRSGLDMIRQKAQNTDYIDPIIKHAANHGLLLLLEFLASIGVDID
jgi:hypothetical protein